MWQVLWQVKPVWFCLLLICLIPFDFNKEVISMVLLYYIDTSLSFMPLDYILQYIASVGMFFCSSANLNLNLIKTPWSLFNGTWSHK